MDTIIIILLILVFAVLLVIAYELRIIAHGARETGFRESKERESREVQTAGQTINVNLSPLSGIAPVISTAESKITAVEEHVAVVPSESENEVEYVERPSGASVKKIEPNGVYAVKCSRCQAENSSYRHECFNCGNAL